MNSYLERHLGSILHIMVDEDIVELNSIYSLVDEGDMVELSISSISLLQWDGVLHFHHCFYNLTRYESKVVILV